MRSRHVDHFNNDGEVHGYDDQVADESNPVRDGYSATLDWVIEQAAIGRNDVVIDLGTGTGNLAARVGHHARLVCVDVSTGMLAQPNGPPTPLAQHRIFREAFAGASPIHEDALVVVYAID